MKKTKTLEYNKQTDKITLNIYDDEFLLSETDITAQTLTLALEKLYDDYSLEQGDESHIVKKKGLEKLLNLRLKANSFLFLWLCVFAILYRNLWYYNMTRF